MKPYAIGFLAVVVASSVWGATVTLQWDPNSEQDLAGYKVYLGPESGVTGPFSGCTPEGTHPYNGIANEGSSPITYYLPGQTPVAGGYQITIASSPEATLTGISDTETTYYRVTAYDTEGLESIFSNEVHTPTGVTDIPPEPDTTPPATPQNLSVAVGD